MSVVRLCLILSFATWQGHVHGQELGRLFLSSEQRTALDARRKAKIPEKTNAAVEASYSRLDGYVQRSSGPSTVFVNGDPVLTNTNTEGIRAQPSKREPGKISISIGEADKPVELRVGQTLERITGTVADVVTGEIRTVPRKP